MASDAKILPKQDRKYRLITRSDMDGLVCAVILKELDLIDDIKFVHPKDMQDGLIPVTENDITTNLPYVDGVYLCFDHHASEVERAGGKRDNHVIDDEAPSAARVVFDYFDGWKNPRLGNITEDMMEAVDKADAAQFTKEDILDAKGWELLSFIMDARTGLGRFRNFRISNYDLMMELIDYIQDNPDINSILQIPDVKERVELYEDQQIKFRAQLEKCADVQGPLVVLDLRHEPTIYAGNRFMIYALFPQCNVSMHVMWGKDQQNTVCAIGKSILNRTNTVHVGNLCLEYGGGGHAAAGTCQLDNDTAEDGIKELIAKLTK